MPATIFKGKTILITGGTGSFGKACVKILLKTYKPETVRIYSRDELKQWEMRRELHNDKRLRFLLGDVRDLERLRRATEGVDILIHAAALKQVPACEYNPIEAVRTNIDGATNIIDAALDNNVAKVLAISTDKAVNPVNLYGATKLCSEKLFVQANNYRGKYRDTKFSVARYGNVLGSRGSVIPLFEHQKQSGMITITDERMTRFWIALPKAVEFVLSSITLMQGGEVFIPKLPSMKVSELAKVIAPEAKVTIIGQRPGEKLHEHLITKEESREVYELKDRYIIAPSLLEVTQKGKARYKRKRIKEAFEYDSLHNPWYLNKKEMITILESLTV